MLTGSRSLEEELNPLTFGRVTQESYRNYLPQTPDKRDEARRQFSTIFLCPDTRDESGDNFQPFVFFCCPDTPEEPVDMIFNHCVGVQGQGPGSVT